MSVIYINIGNLWLNFICIHFTAYYLTFFLAFWYQLRFLCEELETIQKSKFDNEEKLFEEIKFLVQHHLKLIE